MGLFFKRAEQKDETIGSELLTALLDNGYVTREIALSIPAFSSCVNKIAGTIAGLNIKLYKETDGKVEEITNDKRLFLLNDETGDTLSAYDFKKSLVLDYLLGKGGYAYINRDGCNIESLHYVDEKLVSFYNNNNPIFKSYMIYVNGKKYFDYEFLKILRNTKNGYSGQSLVNELQMFLKTNNNTMKLEKNLVSTGGHKKGFLKSPKKLTQGVIDDLKEKWRKLYSNTDENMIVLNDGIDFQEANSTSVEMQLNENKKANSDDICKIFGVTSSFITGNLTENDEKANLKYCLNPILTNIETALNASLLLESEKGSYFFEFDTSQLTKSDVEKRYSSYKTAIEAGFMSVDEVRYKENLHETGFNYLKMNLADGIYDPETAKIHVLNTGQEIDLKGGVNNENRNKSG